MKHIHQSRLANCGQTVVAMVVHRPVSAIENILGTRGCTSSKQLRQAFDSFGFDLKHAVLASKNIPWASPR